MASQIHQLHFILIPLMSQSHLVPFTDMARLLASHGPTVSIITTPMNAARFKTIVDDAVNSNIKIQLIPLRFPCQEAGLPEGCESMDALPSRLMSQFLLASSMLQEPIEKLLAEVNPRPSCIIADLILPWTSHVALKFKIPRLIFHVICCFTLLCSHNISHYNVLESVRSDSEPFLVPHVPDRIEFTKAQLPRFIWENFASQLKEFELSGQGVMVNSFEELEPGYVKEYKKVVNKVWCVGPVSLCNKEMSQMSARGNTASVDAHHCLKWLDSMEPSSVIYACFGTNCHISPSQSIEIGLGLEASNRPFIWVIRGANYSSETEEWFAEQRFEERIKGRGLVIKGWAPQVLILSHPAVGGFLTHCGWNSTLEGVSAGVPLISWPLSAEQFFNEKLLVQVFKIGVRIGVEVLSRQGGEEGDLGVMVKREEVKKAIDELMDGGEEAVKRKERARELRKMAEKAMGGGSSYSNMALMIQDIMKLLSHNEEAREDS